MMALLTVPSYSLDRVNTPPLQPVPRKFCFAYIRRIVLTAVVKEFSHARGLERGYEAEESTDNARLK
jgi:hypothetical protein